MGDKTFFVQCVRGNTEYGINLFGDNGDGTVTEIPCPGVGEGRFGRVSSDWASQLAGT